MLVKSQEWKREPCIWKERNNTKVKWSLAAKGLKQDRPDKKKVYLDLPSNYAYERKADKSLFFYNF